MPLPEIPWWANALGGAISGGVLAKLIDAVRERGKALHGERISLREFEERLRASVLHENEDLRLRLVNLESRFMELLENERKCDERNRELQEKVVTLETANEDLRRDLDAISSALDEQSRRIISESSSERRAHRDNLRTLRDGMAQAIDAQKARHGS